MDHVNALPTGTRLQEYTIREVLGAGGFGITYRADDTNLNKVVAIKEYLPGEFATRTNNGTVVPNSSADAADYQWGLSRFLDEARALARFDHPHLNKVYRFFEGNGTAYMVLEYVEGQTVSKLLARCTTLPAAALQRLIHEVLSGLEDLHAAGYIHRDLKPGNLMVRPDGSAVVLDFGAARQAIGKRSKSVTAVLTPGYAPIEQYATKDESIGPWTDLYALGMVAYRCVSGMTEAKLPDAVTRSLSQRGDGQDLIPAVKVGGGRYDARLLAAIDWAIQVNKQGRPQNIAQWREQLPTDMGSRIRPAREASPPGQMQRTGLSKTSRPRTLYDLVSLSQRMVEDEQVLKRNAQEYVKQGMKPKEAMERAVNEHNLQVKRAPDTNPPEAVSHQAPTKSLEKQLSGSKIRPKKVRIAVKLIYLQGGIFASWAMFSESAFIGLWDQSPITGFLLLPLMWFFGVFFPFGLLAYLIGKGDDRAIPFFLVLWCFCFLGITIDVLYGSPPSFLQISMILPAMIAGPLLVLGIRESSWP